MTTRIQRSPGWITGATALLLLAGDAAAQQGFRLNRTDGEISVETRYENVLRDHAPGEIDEDEWQLIEGIEYGVDGWAFDPALASYRGGLGIEFMQDYFRPEGPSANTERDRMRLSYDLRADLLPERPTPLFLGVTQTHSEIDSPLTPRRDIDAYRFLAGINFRELEVGTFEVPSILEFRHEDTDTNGLFATQRTLDELRLRMNNETQNSQSRLEADLGSLENRSTGISRTIDRLNLRLMSDRYFSNGALGSRFLLTDTNDTRDVASIGLAESLVLRHRPSLNSSYAYAFNHLDSDGSDQSSHYGSAGITHQLFQSLTSSASVGGSYADLELGQITSAQGSVGFSYTKQIPSGNFGLRLSPTYGYQDEDTEEGILTILGESHGNTLSPIQLSRPFVLPQTIVVRDPLTQIEFVEGIDYQVLVSGNLGGGVVEQAAIQVVPGSELDPALGITTIAIDYDVQSQPAATFSTRTIATGASLSLFQHLYADVSYSDSMRDLLSGTATELTQGDEDRWLASLQTSFEHHFTRLEFERIRSPFSPRDRWSFQHNMSFRPSSRMTLALGAGYSRDKLLPRESFAAFEPDPSEDFNDSSRLSEAYSFTVNANWWALDDLVLRLHVLARKLLQEEQDTLAAGTALSATYRYGLLEFQLKGQLQWREADLHTGRFVTPGRVLDDQSEERYTAVILRVSRSF